MARRRRISWKNSAPLLNGLTPWLLYLAGIRLRRAISRWYEERYNVDIDPESEAIVTIGSKEGWRT